MTKINTTNASLIVVGTGIKFLSHLTTEAKVNIEQADRVLYLVNEPVMQEWIQRANPHAESLDPIYFKHEKRLDAYNAITDYILSVLKKGLHVCVVLYGHPSVYAKPALDAVSIARKEGYVAALLPGISAEDCLFADLLIDPGTYGCLSIEATDLLIHSKQIDPTCHLIIWQVSAIGGLGHLSQHDNAKGLGLLTDYLIKHYNNDHIVTLYVAAQYPNFEPTINRMMIADLRTSNVLSVATLYVPPIRKAALNENMLEALGINKIGN